MTKAIARTNLNEILAAADGDYVGAWKSLVKAVGEELTATNKRSTIDDRKARWAAALETMERRGPISEINKKMQGFVRAVRAQTIGANTEPREMTVAEADDLMAAFLDARDIAEFVATFKDEVVRPAVFADLDARGIESGRVTTNLGTDFCRDVLADDIVVDKDGLREALGEELAAKVFVEKVVVTTDLDTSLLMAEAQKDPALLEVIREHLVTKPRTARFSARASKATTEKE